MFAAPPDEAELSAFGLTAADYGDEPPIEIWPDCLPAVELFETVSDQWRMSMSGPVALDHLVVFHELDRMGLEKEAYDDLYRDVRVLAREALDVMREGQEARAKR